MTEGDARSGPMGSDLCPEDARALLHAWLDAVDLRIGERDLLALLQSDGFSHADLERRARRRHERRLREAVERLAVTTCSAPAARRSRTRRRRRSWPARRAGSARRATASPCAWRSWPTGSASMHGVTHTLEEIRERGVPGFEVEVVGTDCAVDRRLSAAAELDVPYYAGLRIGVPSLPAVVEALAEGRYGLVHVTARPGRPAWPPRRWRSMLGLPLAGSYHTELVGLRGDPRAAELAGSAPPWSRTWSRAPSRVLRRLRRRPLPVGRRPTRGWPSSASTAVGRWDRGVDVARFSPGAAHPRGRRARAGPLRRPADAREGRRPARLGVPGRAGAGPAAGARAGRRRAGGGGAARAAARRGAVSRLARGRRAGPRLRGRGPLPLLLADRHVRAGGAGGAGVRAPGRRGERRRAGRARGGRALGRPLPRQRRGARRRGRRPGRRAPRPGAPRPRRAGRGARAQLGGLARRPRRRLGARAGVFAPRGRG